jgi:hypothetical protein
LRLSLLCLAGAAGLAASAFADEGMWTFDNFPSATVKAKFRVVVYQAMWWLRADSKLRVNHSFMTITALLSRCRFVLEIPICGE